MTIRWLARGKTGRHAQRVPNLAFALAGIQHVQAGVNLHVAAACLHHFRVARLPLAMSASSLPSPSGSSPIHNGTVSKRYDRQIRIWGAHGQALLQSARICMLGAGPAATETLKNLVLGGIASFTIVDHGLVTQRDLGNNFFFDEASLGSGRAEAATRLLRELNDSVRGSFSDSNVHEVLQSRSRLFEDFDLVIASDVRTNFCYPAPTCLCSGPVMWQSAKLDTPSGPTLLQRAFQLAPIPAAFP